MAENPRPTKHGKSTGAIGELPWAGLIEGSVGRYGEVDLGAPTVDTIFESGCGLDILMLQKLLFCGLAAAYLHSTYSTSTKGKSEI